MIQNLEPRTVCLAVWILLLPGGLLASAGPAHPVSGAVGSLLVLTSMYGYPILVSAIPQLNVSTLARRLAIFCVVMWAVLFAVGFLTGSSGYTDADSPAWSLPIGLAVAVGILVPFIVAATALRRLERAVGWNVAFGAVSAFLWLFYWPVGVFFFHRRLQGAMDRRATIELERERRGGERPSTRTGAP